MKNIDETELESLALVINFAEKIQSSFKDVEIYSNYFPSFDGSVEILLWNWLMRMEGNKQAYNT